MVKKWRLTEAARQKLRSDINAECSLPLSDGLLDRFISMGEPIILPRGRSIVRAGDTDDNVYIIAEGIMRIWYMDGDREVTEAFGLPAAFVLSMHSYYAGLPSSVNYEACTQVKLLRIARADYDRLIDTEPEFARWCLRVAQCQLYHNEVRTSVINGTAPDRYRALVDHRPEIIASVPLRIIASYLRITPEYLSKLRRIGLSGNNN